MTAAVKWTGRRKAALLADKGERFYTAELGDELSVRVERSGEGWINTIVDGRAGGSPGFSIWRPTAAEAKEATARLVELVERERRSIAARWPAGTRRPSMAERVAELSKILEGGL